MTLQRALSLLVPALLCGAASGCDDLDRFSTEPGEAYCGAVTLGGSFRTGISPRVQMRLEIDAGAIDGPEPPGTLTTYEAATEDQAERRLLAGAALRPIAPLAHDALSRLEFGEGRERNAIFAVSPADPAEEALLSVVSFQSDGAIEVRLLRPGALVAEDGTEPGSGRRQMFGIFRLAKRKEGCGF
ncbi:hypothetical protein [Chondromyces apiculatus]|uniref:Lipoprotein n=1 Tax=Chondromyces apiculatus DSM 436 TaxID=1192034 RepID=A0A017STS9_9BACT|nr:hypothetical protein [Chondromyces apiculatus]EYF00167.1 Hypothetical protein CAP_1128 [Chondromyces apiculatus DSM 436]